MPNKSKSFKKYLTDAMESDIPESMDLEKTVIEDTPAIDIPESKVNINKLPIGELTQDQKEILQLRNIMADTRMRDKLAKGGLSGYARGIPENLKKAKELTKKIKGVTALGKFAGPVGAAIGVASDVLGIEDVGEGQDEPDIMRDLSSEERRAMENIKKQSEELAKKPISPIEMIKEVGGAADVNPKQARLMQGEQESPDIEDESSINMQNYEKMLRKKLGYR